MRISDLLSVCFRNLTRRKVRTALTVIGVVIGVCAIILMVSLGIGAKTSMEQMMQEWGDLTIINVMYFGNSNSDLRLNDEAVSRMQAIPGVDLATPFYNAELSLELRSKNERYTGYVQVIGVYPDAVEKLGFRLAEGSYLPPAGGKKYSMVVGSNVPFHFRDTKKKNGGYREPFDMMGNPQKPFVDVMKDKLVLAVPSYEEGKKEFKLTPHITGIMEENYNKGWETAECCFMNINDLKELEEQNRRFLGEPVKKKESPVYSEVRVKCTDVKAVAEVQQAIRDMGFETSSMEDTRDYFNKQLGQVQAMLGGLAAISLLVAAIGIANTMVMSIYERTKEIGVMKVIGAEIRDIRAMFLTESAMIGLIGGIVGVVLSFLLSYLMNNAGFVAELLGSIGLGFGGGGKVSVIPWWLVGIAMAFSLLVGVVFGFIPANRAVKISALEAIRHD